MEISSKEQRLLKYKLIWEKTGRDNSAKREKLNISIKEIASVVGCCEQTLRKFEHGGNIRSRRLFEASYNSALKIIPLHRLINAGQVFLDNRGSNHD